MAFTNRCTICYWNVQNLNVINMNVSPSWYAGKMRAQSNIQFIQSFWREIWITMEPQHTSSHFKEHIYYTKHHQFAGKAFRIPWIEINVIEAKCSSSISLYSHTDLLVQSTNMQISKNTAHGWNTAIGGIQSGLWDDMTEKDAFS